MRNFDIQLCNDNIMLNNIKCPYLCSAVWFYKSQNDKLKSRIWTGAGEDLLF